MKYAAILFFLTIMMIDTQAQPPSIVKAVTGAVTEPKNKDQEGWKNNEWNGKFFYQGTGSGVKLCVTDGTNGGTIFVADLGTSQTFLRTIPAQDFIYIITARTASFSPLTVENQIWKSDGTAGGTSLVFTTIPAPVSVTNVFTSDRDLRKNFSVSGNTMYFGGYDATNGNELWVTDGTTAGTHIVKDIKAGIGNSSPQAFCKIGTDVFFTATEVSSERKLWKTDGTATGTVQIAVTEPFYILDNAVGIVNNKMIFYAHNTVDGYEPYVSDGTAAGTFMLKNIHPSGNSWLSQSQNAHLRFNGQYCFFIANNGTANALWRTDGTSAGTIQLTNDAQAAFSGVSGGSYTEVDNNGLWMIEYNAGGSGNNEKLYRSDGTVAGTYLAASGLSYAQYVKSYNGGLWMASRNTGSPANVEPWRSGGNATTTNKAFEIEPGNSGAPTFTPLSSSPYGYFVKDGKLYFFASTSIPSAHNLYQYTGDFTFNGSQTGGKWGDSANWNSMMPPGITDVVHVNAGTPNMLQIDGATAYAGVLNLGNNATINSVSSTDSLIVNNSMNASGNNNFNGNGILAFRNINSNGEVQLSGAVTATNIAVQSNSSLLAGDLSVSNNINFTTGKLMLNNNNLILAGSSSSITNTPGFYVVTNGTGSLQVENIGPGGRTGEFTFPVGTATQYTPASITNTGSSDVFRARVIPNLYSSYSGEVPGASQYTTGAVGNTWFINEGVPGGSNVDLKLQWNQLQELPAFDRTQTQLGHYTAGAWNLGTTGAAEGSNPYTYTRTGITSFSPFGIMNNNATLPLTFLNFSVQKCNSNSVCLNWKTANEQNVSHFEVERSGDGRNFTTIRNEAAKNQPLNLYSYIDDVSGFASGLFYYRIKQIDTDGRFSFSNIQVVKADAAGVSIYPSVVETILHLNNFSNKPRQLQLFSANGALLLTQTLKTGSNEINLTKYSKGALFYRIFGNDGFLQSGNLIKQ